MDRNTWEGSSSRLGKRATVWDGEIMAINEALKLNEGDEKVAILSDSQAAIMAITKAGRRGRANTRELKEIVDKIQKRKENHGEGATVLVWVEAHVSIRGNEKADELAKGGASLAREGDVVTEGGIKQEWKERGRKARQVEGYGKWRAVRWNRKALHTYTQCRTNKGRLGQWRNTLDPWSDPGCRWCGEEIETGTHAAIVCHRGEWIGRRWSSWKEMDDRKSWARKEIQLDREVTIDLVEDFFHNLEL